MCVGGVVREKESVPSPDAEADGGSFEAPLSCLLFVDDYQSIYSSEAKIGHRG